MEVSDIVKKKYSDAEFLYVIDKLDNDDVIQLHHEVEDIYEDCCDSLRKAIKEFKDTGIPKDPEWFHKCKRLANIRKRHLMMIQRELKMRNITKDEVQNTR